MTAPRLWVAVLVCAAVLCAGPRAGAGDDTASVHGLVTWNGKPLDEGRVFIFVGDDQFVGAKIKDGRYKVDRVPVGEHAVGIEGRGVHPRYMESPASRKKISVTKGTNEINFDLK